MLTVRMGDEDLGYFTHFDIALLYTVLRRLTAVKEPDITVQAQCKSRMVSR